jgi:hypothetical protein
MNGGLSRPVADSSVAGSSASIAEVKFGRAGLPPRAALNRIGGTDHGEGYGD